MQHLAQSFAKQVNLVNVSMQSTAKKRYKLFIKQDGVDTYLTKKEVIVVALLMRGMRAKQIAWELKSSLHTVNTHLTNIKDKLNCNNIFHLGLMLGKYRPELEVQSNYLK